MIIGQFTIELHGNREVTLNGRALMSSQGKHMLDEKIVQKNLTNDQLLSLICEQEQMLAKLRYIQVNRAENSPHATRTVISVGDGIKGVVGPLGGSKRKR